MGHESTAREESPPSFYDVLSAVATGRMLGFTRLIDGEINYGFCEVDDNLGDLEENETRIPMSIQDAEDMLVELADDSELDETGEKTLGSTTIIISSAVYEIDLA